MKSASIKSFQDLNRQAFMFDLPKTSKQQTKTRDKPASTAEYAKILGKLGGRPKKDTNGNSLHN